MTKQEERDLIKLAQAGYLNAADELIRYCTPIIHSIAKRQPINTASIDYQDVMQSGRLGVLDAIRLWREDKARGRFGGFARIHIQHSITRLLDEMNETIRIPIGGRRRGLNPIPIVISGGDDYSLDECCPAPKERLEGIIVDQVEVRSALKELSSRERLIVRKLFWDESTLEDIARDLGLSLRQVHYAKEKALAKLKGVLGHYNPTNGLVTT